MTQEKWYDFDAGGARGWEKFDPNYKERIIDASDKPKKAVKESGTTKEKWYDFDVGGATGWEKFDPNYKERIVDTPDNLKKAVKESGTTKEKWYDFDIGGATGWAELNPSPSWKKAAVDAVKKGVKKSGISRGSVQARRSKSLPKG